MAMTVICHKMTDGDRREMHEHNQDPFSQLRALGSVLDQWIRHAVVWLIQAFVLMGLVEWFVQGPALTFAEALVVILVVAVVNTALMPLLIRLAVRFTAWLFPIVSFMLNAMTLVLPPNSPWWSRRCIW